MMKMQLNCLLAALIAVSQLSSGYARSCRSKEKIPNTSAIERMEEFTIPQRLGGQPAQNSATIGTLVNSTELRSTTSGRGSTAAQNTTAMAKPGQNTTATAELGNCTTLEASRGSRGQPATADAQRIVRKKREMKVETAYDFHTTHLFCDFDDRGRHQWIWFMPNHCIWVWNNKYSHEGFYRLFKTYQMEGFHYGQWYECQTRLELK
ncbi:uncharacterized protein LOC111082275 [Drosophila obscura]|uniref:uncharacterized protein LOC111082275 n=1 Tax=Drosophila obscura TaxID=7282 RepID=UPI001BB2CCBF|nr:uncharacterized protein LOC111082275 [Drosophila obscura]